MPSSRHWRLASAMLLVTSAAIPAIGRDARVGQLRLTNAWSRPTPPGAPAGAGYLTITNTGGTSDRLLGASSPAAARVEVHEMKLDGGIMRMRPVQSIAIPPGQSVQLEPGGYHIMLIGPKRRFAAGGEVPVTLRFERAGTVEVDLDVRTTPPKPSDVEARR